LADPGDPKLEYGAKGDAELFLSERKVGYAFYRIDAPFGGSQAHFFATPDINNSPGVDAYYVSLVVDDDAAWAVQRYERVLGGRVAIKLSDGTRYESDSVGLKVKLDIAETNGDLASGVYYLRGRGEITVPAVEAGAPPLKMVLTLNSPGI
jgi:hypothetical protein